MASSKELDMAAHSRALRDALAPYLAKEGGSVAVAVALFGYDVAFAGVIEGPEKVLSPKQAAQVFLAAIRGIPEMLPTPSLLAREGCLFGRLTHLAKTDPLAAFTLAASFGKPLLLGGSCDSCRAEIKSAEERASAFVLASEGTERLEKLHS
jgi:Fe-S cluster biogenesis protein NfuA